jgi:hypothetical protein
VHHHGGKPGAALMQFRSWHKDFAWLICSNLSFTEEGPKNFAGQCHYIHGIQSQSLRSPKSVSDEMPCLPKILQSSKSQILIL